MPLLTVHDVTELVERVLAGNGFSQESAHALAASAVAAESCGTRSHGLFRVPGYIAEVASGWADGKATPIVADVAPGVIVADARNGYCQTAYLAARELLIDKARRNGIAGLAIRDGHHLAALWPEAEDLAGAGLVALTFRNARAHMLPHGGNRKIYGTNPMAFACPRRDGPPIVFDQSASVMSRGDLTLASQERRRVPPGTGVDREGAATTDPQAILDGGALLPFGGHKGSLIALMVELMAGALTGSSLSSEDGSAAFPGAQSARSGQFFIAIDASKSAGATFAERVDAFVDALRDNGEARIPGIRRDEHRQHSLEHGIDVSTERYAQLRTLAGEH